MVGVLFSIEAIVLRWLISLVCVVAVAFPLLLPCSVLAGMPSVMPDGNGLNHYAGNRNIFEAERRLDSRDLPQGGAQTVLIGEVNGAFAPWAEPRRNRDLRQGINQSPQGFGGAPGAGGAQFAMADGAIRFLSEDTDPAVLEALSGAPSPFQSGGTSGTARPSQLSQNRTRPDGTTEDTEGTKEASGSEVERQ